MEIALRFLRYSEKIARAYSARAQKFYSMEINLYSAKNTVSH